MRTPLEMESNLPRQSMTLNPSSQSQEGMIPKGNDVPTTTLQPLELLAIALHDIHEWMKHIIYQAYSTIRSLVSLSSDVDEILEKMPHEQQEQHEQLEHIQEDQIEKRKELEALKERLQAIEERRLARENRH